MEKKITKIKKSKKIKDDNLLKKAKKIEKHESKKNQKKV